MHRPDYLQFFLHGSFEKHSFCFGGFMAQVTIMVRKNGSLRVEDPNGIVEMVDADGTKHDLAGKTPFPRCCSGDSATRPFCDGSHNKIAFAAPDSAVTVG